MGVQITETKVKDDNFIVIQGWMLSKLHLIGNDLLVYAIIYGFTQDGYTTFKGSQRYLADWCNATERGIKNNLKRLLDDELIEAVCVNERGITEYRTVLNKTERDDPKVSHMKNENRGEYYSTEGVNNIPDGVNNIPIGGEYYSDNNIDNNIELKDSRKDSATSQKDLISKFVNDFSSICISYPKIRGISPNRKHAILKLLNKYSYDDILLMLHKAEESDFLTNRNKNNDWCATFDWILKDTNADKILEGNYDNRGIRNNKHKFGEDGKISSKQVTKEEIANGYFTDEVY